MKRFLAAFIALLLLIALPAHAAPIFMPNVSLEMASADFWLDSIDQPDQLILSQLQIAAMNSAISINANLMTRDIRRASVTFDACALMAALPAFTPEKDYYIRGTIVSPEYFDRVKAILPPAPVVEDLRQYQYGLAVRFADIKIQPFEDIISESPNVWDSDAFQYSALYVGEGALIMLTTTDGQWHYVMSDTATGWVRAQDIAICPDITVWLNYLNSMEMLVVTDSNIRLAANAYSPEISELELCMGTKLPLMIGLDPMQPIDGRHAFGSFVVSLPTRGDDGACAFKRGLIPYGRTVSSGYLAYTPRNILEMLFRMQADRYGVGSMMHAQDCSGYLMSVYRCFGYTLPRDSARIAQIPAKITDLAALSDEDKLAAIAQLSPGAMLHFPGFIMAYLGTHEDTPYVISDISELIPAPDMPVLGINSVIVSDLNVMCTNGQSWLSAIEGAIELRP